MRREPLLLALLFTTAYMFTFSHFLNGFIHDEFRLLNVVKGIQEYGVPMFLDYNFYLHPPLLMYEIYIVSLFMPIDTAAIIIELVCAFGTIIFIYMVARRFLGEDGAIATAIITGFHSNLWTWSNRFLFEAPLLMMFTLCTYLFFKAYDYNRTSLWTASGLSIGALLSLKFSGLVLLAIIGTFLLLRDILQFNKGKLRVHLGKLRKAVILAMVSLIVFVPYLVYITINNAPSSSDVLFSAMVTGAATFAAPEPWHYYITDLPNLLNYGVLSFFLIGTILSLKNRSEVSALLLWLVVPIIIFSFPSFKNTRYVNPIFPFCVIVAVYGMVELGLSRKSTFVLTLLIASFGAYQSLSVVLYDGEWPSSYDAWNTINALESNGVLLAHDYWWAAAFFTDGYVSYITGNPDHDYSTILFYNSHYLLADSDWVYLSDNPIFERVEFLPELNSTLYSINWAELSKLFPGQTEVKVRLTYNDEPLGGAIVTIDDQQFGRVPRDGRFTTFLSGSGIFSLDIKKVCYVGRTIHGGIQDGALYQCESPGVACTQVSELSVGMERTNCVHHPGFTLDRY